VAPFFITTIIILSPCGEPLTRRVADSKKKSPRAVPRGKRYISYRRGGSECPSAAASGQSAGGGAQADGDKAEEISAPPKPRLKRILAHDPKPLQISLKKTMKTTPAGAARQGDSGQSGQEAAAVKFRENNR
jgi:hypothetical protein